MSLPLNG